MTIVKYIAILTQNSYPRMTIVTLASVDTLTEGYGVLWPSTDYSRMTIVTLASADTLTEWYEVL